MATKPTATKSVTYSGGLDSVTLHFLSGHVVVFPNGTPVEVCAEDASVLADNPDFQSAPTKATTTTTEPHKEVSS